jgi:hypothetical protein
MGMQQYDVASCGGGLLHTMDIKTYKEAVGAYYLSGECVAEFEAYTRANAANLKNVIGPLLVNAFNTKPASPPALLANVKAHLYSQADTIFTQSVKTGGDAKLTTEQSARNTYWTTGLGKGEFPDLFTYVSHGLAATYAKHKTTPRQAAGYAALLGAIVQPFQAKTAHNAYNQTYIQATKAVGAIAALSNLASIRAADGSLNEDALQWKKIEECVNYWSREMSRQEARRTHVEALADLVPNATEAKLLRLISGGEKDFIADNGKVAQGPGSYERHKWFFYGDGAPGVGHEWRVEVKLSKNILDYMLEAAIECGDEKADSTQAFIKKSNEHNCIGIHEDVLRPLHAKFTKFILTSDKTKSIAAKTVAVKA